MYIFTHMYAYIHMYYLYINIYLCVWALGVVCIWKDHITPLFYIQSSQPQHKNKQQKHGYSKSPSTTTNIYTYSCTSFFVYFFTKNQKLMHTQFHFYLQNHPHHRDLTTFYTPNVIYHQYLAISSKMPMTHLSQQESTSFHLSDSEKYQSKLWDLRMTKSKNTKWIAIQELIYALQKTGTRLVFKK